MKRIIALLTVAILVAVLFGACSKPVTPLTVAELLDLGEKYLLEINYEQAVVQFLKVIEVEPMNPRGYTGAAEAYVGLDKGGDAIEILRRGLDLTGNDNISEMYDKFTGVNKPEKPEDSQSKQPTEQGPMMESDYIIEWVDPTFEALIRKALDKSEGDIWRSELDHVESLYIEGTNCSINISELSNPDSDGNIESLKDIINFANLNDFRIVRNKVTDLSPLSSMTKLSSLDIWDNPISDLTPLSNLSQLKVLRICNAQIKDITPINGLVNMEYLWLNGNQISNITPLENMVRLINLYLYDNQISDITVLKNIANIQHIELSNNPIGDWSPVEHVPTVRR